jgi:uncharacterized damage-inducible protein DinB
MNKQGADPMGREEVLRLLDQMDRMFSGDAWHGPPVWEVLQGVTAEEAASHPVPTAHNIWETVLHLSAWMDTPRIRIEGEALELTAEEDWPAVDDTSEDAWVAALHQLRSSFMRLSQAVSDLDDARLEQIVPGQEYSHYVLLHGVVQHNLYHLGQIALLAKTSRS